MKNNLTDRDREVGKKVGFIKLARANIKLYNKLCSACKLKTMRINKRGKKVGVKDYCVNCQAQVNKILGALQ